MIDIKSALIGRDVTVRLLPGWSRERENDSQMRSKKCQELFLKKNFNCTIELLVNVCMRGVLCPFQIFVSHITAVAAWCMWLDSGRVLNAARALMQRTIDTSSPPSTIILRPGQPVLCYPLDAGDLKETTSTFLNVFGMARSQDQTHNLLIGDGHCSGCYLIKLYLCIYMYMYERQSVSFETDFITKSL